MLPARANVMVEEYIDGDHLNEFLAKVRMVGWVGTMRVRHASSLTTFDLS
jgi:hypothetical protein